MRNRRIRTHLHQQNGHGRPIQLRPTIPPRLTLTPNGSQHPRPIRRTRIHLTRLIIRFQPLTILTSFQSPHHSPPAPTSQTVTTLIRPSWNRPGMDRGHHCPIQTPPLTQTFSAQSTTHTTASILTTASSTLLTIATRTAITLHHVTLWTICLTSS